MEKEFELLKQTFMRAPVEEEQVACILDCDLMPLSSAILLMNLSRS